MRRCFAVLLVGLFFAFPLAHAQTTAQQFKSSQQAEADREAKISKLWNSLNAAVSAQHEPEALALAIQLLQAVPIHDAISVRPDSEGGGGWDNRQQRRDALRALKTFHALDEYVRKVKDYYKEDRTNATYDELMAEVLALDDPKLATPFLEDAHKADPANTLVISELAARCESGGQDQELYALVDPILAAGTPVRGGLPIDLIALYTRMNQLPRLAQLVTASLKPSTPGTRFAYFFPGTFTPPFFNYDRLVAALQNAHDYADLIALARANMKHANGNFGRTVKFQFIQFVFEAGDHDAFGQAVTECLFPVNGERDQDIELTDYNDLSGDIPGGELQDIIRHAVAAGQLGRLKDAGHAYLQAHPAHLPSEGIFAFILVAGHDPETTTFLPQYSTDLLAKTQRVGGLPSLPLYAIFGELLSWPEGKSLLKPTLETAEKIELIAQPQNSLDLKLKIARLALKIPDQELARRALMDATASIKNPPPRPPHQASPPTQPVAWPGLARPAPPLVPNGTYPRPDFNLPSVERLGLLAAELIKANLPDEAASLIPLMTDPTKSRTESMPDNPALIIARVAEQAFDANQLPAAKLFAQAAFRQLDYDWRNPQPIYGGVYFATSISPDEVHRIGQLLLELGLNQDLDNLAALLQVPTSSGQQLDAQRMTSDIRRMQGLISAPPRALTPAIWIDHAVPTNGLDRQVAWDMTARTPEEWHSRDTGPISVAGRDLPQLDGKFTLQILAGPAADDLRQIKTLSGINARGVTSVTLQPGDRFLSAIAQTLEAQPHIFVGLTIPISTEPNLFAEIARVSRYSFIDYFGPSPQKKQTSEAPAKVATLLTGGPVSAGSYHEAVCGSGAPRLELVGERQPLAPGLVYLLSGWVRGGGQFGVRYLDQDGQKISESDISLNGSDNDWQFGAQKIGSTSSGAMTYPGAPPNATSIEPYLALGQNGTLDYSDLYLGVTEQSTAASPSEQTHVMDGLSGAVSIAEAPQGKVLAGVFQNGDVRCFDLTSHREMGMASHLPGQPLDMAFVDQGRSVIAVNKTGDVLLRPTDGTAPGAIIYHAPWPVGLLGVSSDAAIVAVGGAENAEVRVFNAATHAEVSHFTVDTPRLVELIVSPDGKYVYLRPSSRPGEIWDTSSGMKLNLTVGDPDKPQRGDVWFNEMAVARFFHLPHLLKVNGAPWPWWLLVKSNVVVQGDSNSVSYSELGQPYQIHKFQTGPITAFCLSTQSDDAYAVSAQGELSLWKLPGEIKLPPFDESTVVSLAVAAPAPNVPPAPGSSAGRLVVDGPGQIRGFPLTMLSQPLVITVRKGDGTPAAGVDLSIQSDLQQATFAPAGSSNKPLRSLKARTDWSGKISLVVSLGKRTGKGAITLAMPAKYETPDKTIALESIDENLMLNPPYNLNTVSSGTAMAITWMDKPDNRTAFLVQRQVDGGPWDTIALLPETATSYNDTDISYGHQYTYELISTNESKYGYPPKLPPPPDRLGNFLP